MHNEAKPIFYFGYLGGRKVLYSAHVGGSLSIHSIISTMIYPYGLLHSCLQSGVLCTILVSHIYTSHCTVCCGVLLSCQLWDISVYHKIQSTFTHPVCSITATHNVQYYVAVCLKVYCPMHTLFTSVVC